MIASLMLMMRMRNAPSGGGSYLLDTYTSASGAWSVARKLSSSYLGNCIRVRRSSDSVEQDIGFVGDVLDISSLLSFCAGVDGLVTTFYGQDGLSKNLTQSTAANQPKIVSAGVLETLGGKPSLLFSGNQRLQNGSDSIFNAGISNLLVSHVSKVTSLSASGCFYESAGGAATHNKIRSYTNSAIEQFNSRGGDSLQPTNSSMLNTAFVRSDIILASDSTRRMALNGVEIGYITSTQAQPSVPGITLGRTASNTAALTGYISELVVWNANFYTGGEYLAIANEQKTYYGI